MSDLDSPLIVIGLLQVKAEPWKSIYENGQLQTWIKNCPETVQIINIYGRTPGRLIRKLDVIHEKLRWKRSTRAIIYAIDWLIGKFLKNWDTPKWKIEKNKNVKNLFVNVPSTNLTLPNVEIAFFKYFLENTNSNLLYMSNTSSYVNVKNLIKITKDLPKNKIYGGTIQKFPRIKFASGSNRIMSRDIVELIVNQFKNWKFQYLDDVALSKLLEQVKTIEVNVPSIFFTEIEEIENLGKDKIESIVHFRLKSGPIDSRKDSELMHHLHKKLLA